MVALNHRRAARAGLDHIRIDGPLGQKVHSADLFSLLLEDPDELLADDLPLPLRLGHPGQLLQKTGLRIHPDKVHGPALEGRLDLVPLVLPHEAVVHKHTRQLLPHGLGQQGRAHGAVHAAGEGQQHPASAHLLTDIRHGGALIVPHGPVAGGMAHLIEEVPDHRHAVVRVVDLRVELDPVEPPPLIRNGHIGAGLGPCRQGEALRYLLHVVPVAHPADPALRQALEQGAGGVVEGLRLAVLPGAVVLGGGNPAPQMVGQELAAVADAQHGHAQGKDGRVHLGRGLQIDRVGAPGEDKADGLHFLELRQGRGIGLDLAVHAALPDPPGDQLVVLPAEVQNNNSLMGQSRSLLIMVYWSPSSRNTIPFSSALSITARA